MNHMRRACWLSLLFLVACESPGDKISRLQRELLEALSAKDYFEITTKEHNIRLPLPLEYSAAVARTQTVTSIYLETCSLNNSGLNGEEKVRLEQFMGQLINLLADNVDVFDPGSCVLTEVLRDHSSSSAQNPLLQKIPEYYAEIERRWHPVNVDRACLAAEKSLQTLEMLEQMGDSATAARFAVKDFMGLCRSAVLAH